MSSVHLKANEIVCKGFVTAPDSTQLKVLPGFRDVITEGSVLTIRFDSVANAEASWSAMFNEGAAGVDDWMPDDANFIGGEDSVGSEEEIGDLDEELDDDEVEEDDEEDSEDDEDFEDDDSDDDEGEDGEDTDPGT